jgi:hypothetical protein
MHLINPFEEHDRVLVTGGCDAGMEGVVVCCTSNDGETVAFAKVSNQEIKFVLYKHLYKMAD